jgi:hypothetical protein
MKNIFNLFILSLALISCDNRDRVVENLNSHPEFRFTAGDGLVFEDSVKVTLKSSKSVSKFEAKINDKDGNLVSFDAKIVQGEGILLINNAEPTTIIPSEISDLSISYKPNAIGTHRLSFEVSDAFGEKASVSALIEAFSNLAPVASWKLNSVKILDPLEYEFDASASFDRDQKFGGAIVKYTWLINEKKIETTKSKFNYIFSTTGNHNISLTVTDNDGASYELSKLISVQ